MQVIIEQGHAPIKAWVDGVELEDAARRQLLNVAALPFIHKHIAVMPDVHWGMGATVGSVIPTVGAIIPAAVGVDIGCGMMAVKTNLTAKDLPDNLAGVRSAIETAVPHGRTDEGGGNDRGRWQGDLPQLVQERMKHFERSLKGLVAQHPELEKAARNCPGHLGTLGTGNHFIEICLDKENCVWVMLHSGSRGIGNRIGSHFIEKAKKDMERWFINLPDKDLAYIPEGSDLFSKYVEALNWAQEFARVNREVMMANVLRALTTELKLGGQLLVLEDAVNCHHNYVAKEHHFGQNVWVTRKGARRGPRHHPRLHGRAVVHRQGEGQ